MAHVLLDDVSVCFDVSRHGRMSLKEYVVRGMFRRKVNPRFTVNALDGISLQLHEGDRFGVIGHNGAGKSTLLKTIAGVYPPMRGRCNVEGRISSLFEVTLGFEPDASGWDNIAYRGYLQGETPTTIKRRLKSIADFSELGDYLDMSVRYYSTGMAMRLAFSIATAIEPEILLVDETLTAGDMAFQKKAAERIQQMVDNARIVVLASHDLNVLQDLTDRCLWIDHGRTLMIGPTDEVIDAYRSGGVPALQSAA
jgi:ABC-type polysaccharide/polyol phosphate transport system ATPase subunit